MHSPISKKRPSTIGVDGVGVGGGVGAGPVTRALSLVARRVTSSLRKALGIGWTGARARKVRFERDAVVYAFERQLYGGCGVPDGDSVSLGLGPKLVTSYNVPLEEKSDKVHTLYTPPKSPFRSHHQPLSLPHPPLHNPTPFPPLTPAPL